MSVFATCRDCGKALVLNGDGPGGHVLCSECRRRRWVFALCALAAVIAHDMLLIGALRWIGT